jgi:hypothetical protein
VLTGSRSIAERNRGSTVPEDMKVGRGGRQVVAAVWAVAGALHGWLAIHATGAVALGLSATLVVAALVGVVLLLVVGQPSVLLAAAVAGAIGVAGFLVPRLVALPGFAISSGAWADPWSFAALLADALIVRLAVFTLRRAARSTG